MLMLVAVANIGYDLVQNEEVAIKLEAITTKTPQLQYESRIYTILQAPSETIDGIPRMRWFGKETTHGCMVMDCLGPSLEVGTLVDAWLARCMLLMRISSWIGFIYVLFTQI
jgi:hypothetical protein